jgi:glycosyltransferase involved in cell wall biosynthesis
VKILHIIDSGGFYGAEVVLLNLMSEQAAMGLEPILASIGDRLTAVKPVEDEARRRGLRVQTFRMRSGLNIAGGLEVLRFAWREQVDLLHSHGYKGNILFGFIPRKLRRIPMVATVHGWTWTGGMTRMMVYEWLDSRSLAHLDRVVLVNRAMKGHAGLRHRARLPLEVVANGIPVGDQPHPQATGLALDGEIRDFCSEGQVIGAIGRLSIEKGFGFLLEAVAGLVAQGRDLRLVLLGHGDQHKKLKDMAAELGIEGRVLMPGYVDEAKNYLPLFQVFVMSSLTEGLPMVLLEAMLAGVPIVASRVGGIPDVLQDGLAGLLVEPGSAETLKLAIADVMARPLEAEGRVRAARQRVRQEFSSQTMAAHYQDIYAAVLQDQTAAARGNRGLKV